MIKVPFLDLRLQYNSIKNEIDKAIQNVIEDSAFVRGEYVEKFEQNFAHGIGTKHCVGVANGTDALTITLKSFGIGKGDEVITVANSFIATSEAIALSGAKAVFVDCLPDTCNMDTCEIESKISTQTKAIIPVHLYGNPADMQSIMEIAQKHNLIVIEDCAQAHLATCKGKNVGTFGHAATFSFYPGKNLGAYGDAGAIITNNDQVASFAGMYANHGRIAKYDHEFEGTNSRMDGLQAAILRVKLKYLPEWTKRRREIAQQYRNQLQDVSQVTFTEETHGAEAVYHLFVIRTKERNKLKTYLEEKGIQTGIHYPIALPNLTAYKYLGYKPEDFPVASRNQEEVLSLPVFPEMTEEQVEYVCDRIGAFFEDNVID